MILQAGTEIGDMFYFAPFPQVLEFDLKWEKISGQRIKMTQKMNGMI